MAELGVSGVIKVLPVPYAEDLASLTDPSSTQSFICSSPEKAMQVIGPYTAWTAMTKPERTKDIVHHMPHGLGSGFLPHWHTKGHDDPHIWYKIGKWG